MTLRLQAYSPDPQHLARTNRSFLRIRPLMLSVSGHQRRASSRLLQACARPTLGLVHPTKFAIVRILSLLQTSNYFLLPRHCLRVAIIYRRPAYYRLNTLISLSLSHLSQHYVTIPPIFAAAAFFCLMGIYKRAEAGAYGFCIFDFLFYCCCCYLFLLPPFRFCIILYCMWSFVLVFGVCGCLSGCDFNGRFSPAALCSGGGWQALF